MNSKNIGKLIYMVFHINHIDFSHIFMALGYGRLVSKDIVLSCSLTDKIIAK